MAVIRLYKNFYRINSKKNNNLYNLLDPFSINVNVFLKNSLTIVESNVKTFKESVGVYYIDLNPNFYSYANTYDVKWVIKYINSSPFKTLITTFKLNPININGGEFFIEIENLNKEIYTEIENKKIEIII